MQRFPRDMGGLIGFAVGGVVDENASDRGQGNRIDLRCEMAEESHGCETKRAGAVEHAAGFGVDFAADEEESGLTWTMGVGKFGVVIGRAVDVIPCAASAVSVRAKGGLLKDH